MKEIPFNDFFTKYQAEEINVVDVREQEEYDALHLDIFLKACSSSSSILNQRSSIPGRL